jgi:hypothetical protein
VSYRPERDPGELDEHSVVEYCTYLLVLISMY